MCSEGGEGLGYRRIGAELGIAPATARDRIQRADAKVDRAMQTPQTVRREVAMLRAHREHMAKMQARYGRHRPA